VLTLKVLDGEFTIHRLKPDCEISHQVFGSEFYSIARTSDELSIVCRSEFIFQSEKSEPGWSCLKVIGPLDFSLTGILAGIADALEKAKISIFAISTYDTDYILIRSENVRAAIDALSTAGYIIEK